VRNCIQEKKKEGIQQQKQSRARIWPGSIQVFSSGAGCPVDQGGSRSVSVEQGLNMIKGALGSSFAGIGKYARLIMHQHYYRHRHRHPHPSSSSSSSSWEIWLT